MAAIWPGSRIPYIDENGDPMVGAQLYFYDEGTTTPQTVYSDKGLNTARAQPIEADARGMFPVIYLSPGTYRQRLLDADGVTIFDDDGISVAQASDYVAPDAGDTSEELLARTGDLKPRYGTGAHSGWVRCNGRTVGSASSGASERASADCEDLFLHLWAVDSSLSVSGGRGGTAAGDWAANKTIALPDFRGRALVGLDTMGASAAGRFTGVTIDNAESADTLGATVGAATHALTTAQLATHTHGASTDSQGNHSHSGDITIQSRHGANASASIGNYWSDGDVTNTTTSSYTVFMNTTGAHTHGVTVNNTGNGDAHPNVQPSMLVSIYIKL